MEAKVCLVPTFLLLLVVIMMGSLEAKPTKMKETKMVLHMHYQGSAGSNDNSSLTAFTVAGLLGKKSTGIDFGSIVVVDGPLTEGIDRHSSKEVGRGQGLFVTTAFDGTIVRYSFSIVFNAGPYNGSTLEIQGLDQSLFKVREVAVVSGTASFRYARGYVTVGTAKYYPGTLSAVMKLTVNVRHPMLTL